MTNSDYRFTLEELVNRVTKKFKKGCTTRNDIKVLFA